MTSLTDTAKYQPLLQSAREAFLTDTSYATEVAQQAGTLLSRVRAKTEAQRNKTPRSGV